MSNNLPLAVSALASLNLVPFAVSGGVAVTVDSTRVTLKDRGNFKVYFTGKEGPARAKALVAALRSNDKLTPKPLTGGTIKFDGATVAAYPEFIKAVRAVIAAGATAPAPVAAPVAAIEAPAKAKGLAAIGNAGARKKA